MNFPVKLLIVLLASFSMDSPETTQPEISEAHQLWLACKLDKEVSYDLFRKAFLGYKQIDSIKNKSILTIIDYSKPSTEKRFYVIDIENKKLLYKCLVAHGKNTGENDAEYFSNDAESLKSSLGFFLTAETYNGNNGYSMKLDGLEKGINDNARIREIVIHGADYVSDSYAKKYGRLGRSWGCPALPPELAKEIIDKLANGSCIFINGKDDFYETHTLFRF